MGFLDRARERFFTPNPVTGDPPPGPSSPGSFEKPIGRSGTVNTRGFIQDREFNPLLIWPRNLDVYEAMSGTDPTVRWMLGLIEYPVRSAEYTVEPASEDPDDLEVAAGTEHMLFNEMAGGFDDFLRQALHFLRYGHSVFELVAELRKVQFSYDETKVVVPDPEGVAGGVSNQDSVTAAADPPPPPSPVNGVPPPLPPPPKPGRVTNTTEVEREMFVIKRLAPRLPRTIIQWKANPEDQSQLGSIVQSLADGQEPSILEIPAARLVVFTCDKLGDDWRGVSILRSAWRAYEYKAQLENAEAIGLDRSVGLPVVYPPNDANPEQRQSVEDAVAAMRQGDSVYLVMPGPKAGTTKDDSDGWLVEDLVVRGEAQISFTETINRYDSELAHNVLAGFMRLGHENVGARSTGETQQDPYYMALETVAGYLCEIVNSQVIRPFVDWNWQTDGRYPKLKADKLVPKAMEVIAAALSSLVPNVITDDPELERWARDLLGAPEKPAELDAPGPTPPAAPPAPAAPPGTKGPGGQGPPPADGDGQAMTHQFSQFMPRRPLTEAEKTVNWQQVKDGLDNGPLDLVAVGERVMAGQIESAQSLAQEAIDANDPELLDRVVLDPAPLTDALELELNRIYANGRADVRAEVRRLVASQPGAAEPGDTTAAIPRIPISASDVAKAVRGLAQNMAESGAQAALRAVKARALKTITQRKETPPAPGEDPNAALRAALRAGATPAVNRTYTLGRMDELQAQAHAGFVDALQYSAILDERTCEECASWDGEVCSPENIPVDVPNPLCQGGDQCRCQWVATIASPSELSGLQ